MPFKCIFLTGGVVSSLGKGLTAASLALLLERQQLKVAMLKLDPYLNVDPGTMNPFEHGEVYVTSDGVETDLDLGHYHRFCSAELSKHSTATSGQIYARVIKKEREGCYLGNTVQVIPHITNEIIQVIYECAEKHSPDVVIGITIAEYYRQMGLNVLLLADSTSRWAQALREISGRLEEIPGEEAFPAYLSSRIAAFYERSGVLRMRDGSEGSLTICGAVSPAGGNFEEPVTQSTLSVVGAFCGLSKARADARRYPSIDPMISWSKYLHKVASILEHKVKGWGVAVEKAGDFIREGTEIGQRMEVVGEEGISMEDMEIFLKAELYDFCYLQQNAFDPVDCYCPFDRQIELFSLMSRIFDAKFIFESMDNARSFFLELQSKIKSLNGMVFHSPEYMEGMEVILNLLKAKMVESV